MSKKPPLPSFEDLEQYETPTMIGRIITGLIGLAGAGNGRCLLSSTLPKFGTALDNYWAVHGYHITKLGEKVTVGMTVQRLVLPRQETKVEGPSIIVSAAGRQLIEALRSKPNPFPTIEHLYKTQAIDFESTEERIRNILQNEGSVYFTAAGVDTIALKRRKVEPIPVTVLLPA